ncbi:MAG TPA: hypothetical protein PKC83_10865 [Gemmatimonadaceae bacterium]|nr:hypothetical protein [Gemmatimonadaceae bacterium]
MALASLAGCGAPHPGLAPHDAALRDAPARLYPAADSTRPPRAIVFFFGNDVGFWRPHQQLAWSLSREQYAVAGFDIRRFLASLPDEPTVRDSVAAVRLARYIAAARRELAREGGAGTDGAPAIPLVLAGHSIGSELALWTAAHLPLDRLVGVLAMSPGNRSHLEISASDLLMTSEPSGPGSFSVAEQVALLRSRARVAIVRGERDKLADADPALLAAGGVMARRWVVPFSGHSLKSTLLGSGYVLRALDWLLAPPDVGWSAGLERVRVARR